MSQKKILFNPESDEDVTFSTENEYAKKYDKWREKEEMHKLEQKYGPNAIVSDASSDSEDDSDEPLEISEELETQFLKTISLLKTKDPRIYDPNFKFFEEQKKQEEDKPKIKTLSFADSDDEDDDNDINIFKVEKVVPENKTDKTEKLREIGINKETKLKDYLIGKIEHINNDVEKDLAPLKALWSDPKLNEGEAFLRDYILNKRYLEEGDAGEASEQIRDDENLEVDEEIVEEQGRFERAYNFRFEEPDEEYLKRFPRTMNYIRPKDDRRARKRAEVRARKEEEKKRKMEEIARLKALKLKEIQEKIAKIKEVTGNSDLAFKEEDIEGDFDPEEHDRCMKAMFDEQYYNDADNEKPVFPELDEELEIENWDNYEENNVEMTNEDDIHCEDEDFNMDADYNPKLARDNLLETIKSNLGKKRRNRKRKSKLAKLLAVEKPKFVPNVFDKTYSEFMDEYYKMDCEDVIGGDLPTRFKYRQVAPNSYGLTVEEILLADDKELTQWVPLKKIVKLRPEQTEKSELHTYAKKAADINLKRKILPSLFKDLPQEPEINQIQENVVKKKKKKKNAVNSDGQEKSIQQTSDLTEDISNSKSNKLHSALYKTNNKNMYDAENNVNKAENVTKKKNKKDAINSDVQDKLNYQKNDPTDDNPIYETTKSNTKLDENKIMSSKKKNNVKLINGRFQNDSNVIDKQNLITHSKQNKQDTFVSKVETKELNLLSQTRDGVSKVGNGVKRKLNTSGCEFDHQPNDKKKKIKSNNNKLGIKNNRKPFNKNNNPLCKLSDERLKAYGLNPKKYRSFLKYKKY